jgi:hypothetical protein
MTEPVTDAEIVAAARERFNCRHVLVGIWTDDGGREWFGASITWEPRPDAGTTWVSLGVGQTREQLLQQVTSVELGQAIPSE